MLESRPASQRDLALLNRQTDRNLGSLNKDKCEVLRLERKNPLRVVRLCLGYCI